MFIDSITQLDPRTRFVLACEARPTSPAEPGARRRHFNIFYQVNLICPMHGEAPLSPLESGMRRLATLCFPAFLCAASAPALAANDRVIVFAPEAQLSQYGFGAASVPAPAPTRGRYGGGFIEALLTGGAGQSQQQPRVRASPRTWKPRPSRNFSGRKSIIQGQRRQERSSSTRPTNSCSWSSRMERRCAMVSALGVRASNGRE